MFKVDFENPMHDSIDWDYPKDVIERMEFLAKWKNWIMDFVSTNSASVIVNGSSCEEIIFRCGFCQRDPLSSVLFLVVV